MTHQVQRRGKLIGLVAKDLGGADWKWYNCWYIMFHVKKTAL